MRRAKSSLFWSFFAFSTAFFLYLNYFEFLNEQRKTRNSRIAIVVVITNISSINEYERPLSSENVLKNQKPCVSESLECYAKIHGYDYLLLDDADYAHLCAPNHQFFIRHCIVSQILPNYDYILFLDADHGVVNPKRRIEEFIDARFDITFYDRFYDWEVSSGSYLVKNSEFSISFLQDWANFGKNKSRIRSGTDNSALHLVLADHLFPDASDQIELCREAYYESMDDHDTASSVACIRHIFGCWSDFGHVRILKKDTGWSRDDWLTSGIWNPQRDFMLHGWKTKNLRPVPKKEIIDPIPMNTGHFYEPLAGPIDLEQCHSGNSTWSYNPKLIGDPELIEEKLLEYSRAIEKRKMRALSRLKEILGRT